MGFFYADARAKKSKLKATERQLSSPKKYATIPLFKEELSCRTCPLDKEEKNLEHAKMKPTGHDDPVFYVLGEAPGKEEDRRGVQFVGKAGQFLKRFLPEELLELARWNNVVRCRPPGNRTPTWQEIKCCSSLQVEDLDKTKPLAIFGFGAVPLSWAVPNAKQTQISAWRGMRVPVRIGETNYWYFPMFHPSYAMRMENNPKEGDAVVGTFKRDIDQALSFLADNPKRPSIPSTEQAVEGLHWQSKWGEEGVNDIHEHLERFSEQLEVSLDLETTCIRPYTKDVRILTISIGVWDYAYSFCLDHRESQWTKKERGVILKALWDFLTGNKKRKIWCHNTKFELEWLMWLYKEDPSILFLVDWHDTMAQAYVLNEKCGKSLEDRCLATMGVAPKDLSNVDVGALDKEPLGAVLRYNAIDTKYTHKLALLQTQTIAEEKLEGAYHVMNKRCGSLAWMQTKGWVPCFSKAEEFDKILDAEQESILQRIARNKDVVAFNKKNGTEFSPSSSDKTIAFFRDFLKRKEGVRGDKYSTDEEVLERIPHPVAKATIEYRQTSKLRGTYVVPFLHGGKHIYEDGLIHPNTNAFFTATGRTSSDEPNGQNFPKHKGKKYIRNVVMAPPEHKMVSIDFGQIEFRVIGMASKDEAIHDALWKGYDIHMDWAKRILSDPSLNHVLARYEEEADGDKAAMLKLFRQDVKNMWTFPLFFGQVLAPVAASLDIPERKLKPFHAEFWKMFKGVKRWQKRMIAFYESHGYVETLTHRRERGPLTINQLINGPIQGTASDIVVDAQDRLSEKAWKEKRPQLQPIMNVHDDLEFYIPDATLEKDIEDAARVMCGAKFPFINVPITVDVSVGTHWGELEELVSFSSNDKEV